MSWLFVLLFVLAGVAVYFMTPDERVRLVRTLVAAARAVRDGGVQRRADQAPFFDVLRERTLLPFVTVALLLLNLVVFIQMAAAPGPLNDPATLVSWGANFGPRTSNGEWWRLLAATFLHDGGVELLLSLACLAQVGFLLERLAGHTAFAFVYVSAAAFASLASLAIAPVAPNVGSAGAIFGLYGLLLAAVFWSAVYPGPARVPWKILREFVPLGVLLVLYQVFAGSSGGWSELAGLTTGLVCGFVLTRGIAELKPPARRIAIVWSASMVLALVSTLPLRGITDVRPEMARVIDAEGRTTDAYHVVVSRFNKGLVPSSALTRVIERQILPELGAMRERLDALRGVPRQHQPMVAAAQEYLRLREESWRLRRDALQRTNMVALRRADKTEWESLQAFKRIRSGA